MSTLKVKNADGDNKFLNVSGLGTEASPYHTISEDFLIAVERGDVPGYDVIHKFGRNSNVPNGSFAFVTTLGQTAHALSAATTVRIKAGGNAADDAGGLGAREITIQGIDSAFNEVTETITTAGALASAVTTKSWWRVHRMWVSAIGTYGASNTGAITLENGTGGTDIIIIGTVEGQTEDAIWTCPIDKTAYLLSVHITIDSSRAADIKIFTRDDIDDVTAPMKARRIMKHFDGLINPFVYKTLSPNTVINGKADIWSEAQASGGNTAVSMDMEFLVIDD